MISFGLGNVKFMINLTIAAATAETSDIVILFMFFMFLVLRLSMCLNIYKREVLVGFALAVFFFGVEASSYIYFILRP